MSPWGSFEVKYKMMFFKQPFASFAVPSRLGSNFVKIFRVNKQGIGMTSSPEAPSGPVDTMFHGRRDVLSQHSGWLLKSAGRRWCSKYLEVFEITRMRSVQSQAFARHNSLVVATPARVGSGVTGGYRIEMNRLYANCIYTQLWPPFTIDILDCHVDLLWFFSCRACQSVIHLIAPVQKSWLMLQLDMMRSYLYSPVQINGKTVKPRKTMVRLTFGIHLSAGVLGQPVEMIIEI